MRLEPLGRSAGRNMQGLPEVRHWHRKKCIYMRAAILSGCSTGKLILKHILPNITGPILVTAMLDIGTMMMELAGLSFLGLGAKPPVAEWGSMMSDTRNLLTTHPWVTFAPGNCHFSFGHGFQPAWRYGKGSVGSKK